MCENWCDFGTSTRKWGWFHVEHMLFDLLGDGQKYDRVCPSRRLCESFGVKSCEVWFRIIFASDVNQWLRLVIFRMEDVGVYMVKVIMGWVAEVLVKRIFGEKMLDLSRKWVVTIRLKWWFFTRTWVQHRCTALGWWSGVLVIFTILSFELRVGHTCTGLSRYPLYLHFTHTRHARRCSHCRWFLWSTIPAKFFSKLLSTFTVKFSLCGHPLDTSIITHLTHCIIDLSPASKTYRPAIWRVSHLNFFLSLLLHLSNEAFVSILKGHRFSSQPIIIVRSCTSLTFLHMLQKNLKRCCCFSLSSHLSLSPSTTQSTTPFEDNNNNTNKQHSIFCKKFKPFLTTAFNNNHQHQQ